jgi:hypothetical protein
MISLFLACQKTAEPAIKERQEANTTASHLGELSQKQEILKKALDRYLQELQNYNTDTIVDLTYPQLFESIDPDVYRQSIVAFINSSQIEEELYETNVTKICKPLLFSNGREFAQAEYTAINRIRFIDDDIYDTDNKMNFLYDVFIHKFGKDNIQFDVENRTITKKEYNKLLMIKDQGEEWKFLGDNHSYRMHYPIILPPEIYKVIEGEENNETC